MAKSEKQNTNNLNFVPNEWPGAFGLYKYSKAVISYNLQNFLLLIICAYIADIAAAYSKGPLLKALFYIIVFLFTQSSLVLLVESVKEKKISFAEALDRGTRLSLKILVLYILIGLGIAISFVLLIVPMFFVLPRLVLAPYYLIDQNMGIIDSLKAAWENGKNHVLKTWAVIGVQVLFGLLSIILIGIYLTIVYSAAFIILYFYTKATPHTAKK